MKRVIPLITIALLLFFSVSSVHAQLDTIPPIDRSLIAAEYFWDTDPGEGSGNPLNASDGSLDELVEDVISNGTGIPVPVGPHIFNVRVLDQDSGWGPVFRTVVHSYDPLITIDLPTTEVTRAEYFWDADPGEGNGSPMLAFDGAFDEMVETVFQSGIPTPPSIGPHTFNIRLESGDDGWGVVFTTVVHSFDPTITSGVTPVRIVQAEYFWDTDPGEGNATAMLAFDGSLDEAVESAFSYGVLSPPANGPHNFQVRFKSEDGNWGPTFRTIVHSFVPVITDSLPLISLVQGEYFWDADPGEGNGTPVIALDGNFNEVVEAAFAGGISHPMPCGPRRFNVRMKSEDGNWGLPFSTVVYVEDTIPPTAVCQDITVQLDPFGFASLDSNAIDGGSTDNCHIVDFQLDTSQYNCPDVGNHTVMMTITDFGGFMDSCSATVTVQDTIPPTMVCQDLTIQLNDLGNAGIVPPDIDNGSSDACGIFELSVDTSDFNCANVGTFPVQLTALDVNGNSANCIAQVTVADTIPPVAVCQDVTIYLDDNGLATATPQQVNNGSTDECGIASMSLDSTTFYCFPIHLTTTRLTVLDPSGNSDSCSALITALDTIPPTATCDPNITVALNSSGEYVPDVPDVNLQPMDNCGIDLGSPQVFSPVLDCIDVGTPVAIYTTYADVSGNSDTCHTIVHVNDVLPPTMQCAFFPEVYLDENGLAIVTVDDIDNGTADECGLDTMYLDIYELSCQPGGNPIADITLTALDIHGNDASCISTVTAVDTIPPTAVCQDVTVYLKADGSWDPFGPDGFPSVDDFPTNSFDGGSTDNCSYPLIFQPFSGISFPLGCEDKSVALLVNVLDQSGNTSTCSATMTLLDTISPVALCQDITIELDSTGQGTATPDMADNGSSDACGIEVLALAAQPFISFDCVDLGLHPNIDLIAMDSSGNFSDPCYFNIFVADFIAPVASCQDGTVYLDANGILNSGDIDASQFDNGSTDNCASVLTYEILGGTNQTFDCNSIGTYAISLTVYDDYFNSSSCAFNLTIADSTSPIAICRDLTIQLDNNGNGSFTSAQADSASTDNCGITSITVGVDTLIQVNCEDVGDNVHTLTVTDSTGNSSTCSFTVSVEDNDAPTAICYGSRTVNLIGAASSYDLDASILDNNSFDNCGIGQYLLEGDSIYTFNCSDLGTHSYDYWVVDVNGNRSWNTCNVSITVDDEGQPTAICQDITVYLNNFGNVSVSPFDIDGGSYDNCGIGPRYINGNSSQNYYCEQAGDTVTAFLEVQDYYFNYSDVCSANIYILDTIAPSLTCQDITLSLNATGTASFVLSDAVVSASDNCYLMDTSFVGTVSQAFACSDTGAHAFQITVTDSSGNTSTACNFNVTVQDTLPPVAICQDVTISLDSLGTGSITADDINNGSNDNCGIDSVYITGIQTSYNCNSNEFNFGQFYAVDVHGNTSSACSFAVIVQDNTWPEVSCNDVTVQLDNTGSAFVPIGMALNSSYDNCGITSTFFDFGSSTSNPDCFDIGTSTHYLSVRDAENHESTCSFNLTVEDNIAPTLTCLDLTVQLNASGNGSFTAFDAENIASDNCSVNGIFVVGHGASASVDCGDLGSNTFYLIADDFSNNVSDSCAFQVLVQDNIAPVAECKNITVNLSSADSTAITPAMANDGSTDNCGVTDMFVNFSSSYFVDCSDVGNEIFNVPFYVQDASGNPSFNCFFDITVLDTIAPVVLCQDVIVVLDEFGAGTVAVADVDAGSTDNCGISTVLLDNTPGSISFACADAGQVSSHTMTITDVNGNADSCQFMVETYDTLAPAITCSDITVSLDQNGKFYLTGTDGLESVDENCNVFAYLINDQALDSVSCMDIGSHNMYITAFDDFFNESEPCFINVTVIDDLAPTIDCHDITVQLDPSGNGFAIGEMADTNGTDNCGITAIALNSEGILNFDCNDIGLHQNIEMIAADSSSNLSGPCFFDITVEDNVPPIPVCQDVTVSLDANGIFDISGPDGQLGTADDYPLNAFDGGSMDNCSLWSYDLDQTSFDCSDVGANTALLTVFDSTGNNDVCTATLTVMDTLNACSTCDSQQVVINTGWNMISGYIIPDAPGMTDVFSGIDQHIIIVKNGAGSAYIPAIPLNLIGNWDVTQGYKVKANADTILTIGCTQVDPVATPISLPAGWSIISYLRDDPMDAVAALASLDDTVLIAKNNVGQMYIPSILNTIGDLLPGQGYQVKLTEASTLLYPANTARYSGQGTFNETVPATHFAIDRNTGNNSNVIIPDGRIEGLEHGDEIGVFNSNGSLTGSVVYEDFHMGLTIWGTDALEGGNDNMTDGEPYRYRLWRPSTAQEYPLIVEYEQGLPYFTTNGISYIRSGYAEGLITDVEEVLDLNTQVFVYPNPANHQVNIEIWLPESSDVLITIHDIAGKQVFRPRQEHLGNGENIIQLDLTKLAVGTYYYRIETRDGSFNGSLVKMK